MLTNSIYMIGVSDDNLVCADRLSCNGSYQIISGTEEELLSVVRDGRKIPVVAYNSRFITPAQESSILEMAQAFHQTQFIVITQDLKITSYRKLAELKNVVVLQSDCPENKLHFILRRIAANQDLQSTRMSRFETDKTVRLTVMRTGLVIPTRMKNYSPGGAFLEYRGISLKVGDRLQMRIVESDEQLRPGQGQLFVARVVWVRDGEGPRSPQRGVGIEFVEST